MNKRNFIAFIFSIIILIVGMVFTINNSNEKLVYTNSKVIYD